VSGPAIERLAAGAVAGRGTPAGSAAEGRCGSIDDHVGDCARCAALVAEQRAIGELARKLPLPALPTRRRAAILAEALAVSDVPVRRSRFWPVTGGLAVAATVAAVLLAHREAPPVPVAIAPAVAPTLPVAPAPPPAVAPLPKAPVAAEVAGTATFTRASVAKRDTLRLGEGEIVIDARDREPVAVTARDTTIAIANARVSVTAHHGVIVATRVFAGSVEVTSGAAHRVLETGEVWSRPLDLPPASAAATSLAAFRSGWEALRGGHTSEAIASFDRATDEVVAEDAAFWAAVAADRGGDVPEAVRRLRAFLERFPASPHADAARASLAKTAP
jgi:hypothetical protein